MTCSVLITWQDKQNPVRVLLSAPSNDVRQRLEELSRQTNRLISFYINTLLEEHLAEIEHAFAFEADAEAARSGKLKTYNLAEARAELGPVSYTHLTLPTSDLV